ncbi:hypothetical protein CPB86DRAFT_775560 [Serendipita vermifera]|nr:hypothetical protein CPB86DRAFT_775560 [Serendipita vermifera]
MKFLLSTAILGAVVQLTSAHYTFPNLIVNGTTTAEWQYVRMTANHWSSGPVTDVTDKAIRCYEYDYNATPGSTSTATVAAGSTVGFKASNTMGHPGYFSAYMTKASPAANSASAGTGSTWFKIWEWAPTYSASTGLVFASAGITQFTFTIPKNLPSGQYLLRGEQIALHLSGSTNGAQFYIGCAQLNVRTQASVMATLLIVKIGRQRRQWKPQSTRLFPWCLQGHRPRNSHQ